jgi:hypothetical protein
MATTKTYLSGDVATGAQTVGLNAYTAPTWAGNLSPNVHLRVEDEIMLVVDTSNAPTIGVVRGYMGTAAIAHKANTPLEYGLPSDFPVAKGPTFLNASLTTPFIQEASAEITATGATGTTAAMIVTSAGGFLNCTGTSGTGINLGYPQPGYSYVIKNNSTGVLKIYSVNATINGTTGTTAFSLTATGNLTATAACATAGAWQIFGNT